MTRTQQPMQGQGSIGGQNSIGGMGLDNNGGQGQLYMQQPQSMAIGGSSRISYGKGLLETRSPK